MSYLYDNYFEFNGFFTPTSESQTRLPEADARRRIFREMLTTSETCIFDSLGNN